MNDTIKIEPIEIWYFENSEGYIIPLPSEMDVKYNRGYYSRCLRRGVGLYRRVDAKNRYFLLEGGVEINLKRCVTGVDINDDGKKYLIDFIKGLGYNIDVKKE